MVHSAHGLRGWYDGFHGFYLEVSGVPEYVRKNQAAEQQRLEKARASQMVAIEDKIQQILHKCKDFQDKFLSTLQQIRQENQDECQSLDVNGSDTLDKTETVSPAIDSIEFEELHSVFEKVEEECGGKNQESKKDSSSGRGETQEKNQEKRRDVCPKNSRKQTR